MLLIEFSLQNAYLYFIISVIFLIGSSLLIHMVFFAREYMWVPPHSKDTLFLSAVRIFHISLIFFLINQNYPYPRSQSVFFLDAWIYMCNWSDGFIDNGIFPITSLSTSTCRWMWLHNWRRSWTNTNEFNT